MQIQHHSSLAEDKIESTSYEQLMKVSGYTPQKKAADLKKSFFSSQQVRLNEEGDIVTAPHSFLGHIFAWLIPYKGIATGKDYKARDQFKLALQKTLLETGLEDAQVRRIIKQAISEYPHRAITRKDLRKLIDMVEVSKREQGSKAKQVSAREQNSQTSTKSSNSLEETASLSILKKEALTESFSQRNQQAEEVLTEVSQLLRRHSFDWKEVRSLREDVQKQSTILKSLLSNESSIAPGAEGDLVSWNSFSEYNSFEVEEEDLPEQKPAVFSEEMLARLREAQTCLMIKEKMLIEYLKEDPFNDKNVLYPRRIYAEAAKYIVYSKIENGSLIASEEKRDQFNEWYQQEIGSYQQADSSQRSQEAALYLDEKNLENPLLVYSPERVIKKLVAIFSISLTASEFKGGIGSVMNKRFLYSETLNQEDDLAWKTVEQQMIFVRGDQQGIYHQISTPLSESHSADGEILFEEGIRGIVPFVRNDGSAPINTRMTQLFKVTKREGNPSDALKERILLHERQQHGINDHYGILDPQKRQAANNNSMRQLLQSGAEADAAFIQHAIEHSEKEHAIFYINTNLTTPTLTPRGPKNNEYAYSYHQGKAMKRLEGQQCFSVLDPQNATRTVDCRFNITCFDFRFPVNYAVSSMDKDWRSLDPGMLLVWPTLKTHNTKEFQKLFGTLDQKAPIGGLLAPIYKGLSAEVSDPIRDEKVRLQQELTRQVEYIRFMFQEGTYQQAGDDRFKMPRHIDLLANTIRRASLLLSERCIRVVNAGGCMSGKDREGVAYAESEAAIIIEDLGGSVMPGRLYSEEDQIIYEHCLTGVVHNTRQVTGIGGSKNIQEIKNQMRDPQAFIYAKGGSQFVSS